MTRVESGEQALPLPGGGSISSRDRRGTRTLRGDRAGRDEELAVSIVMPCLNEAESIEACVRKARAGLERTGFSGEIIVVDNGSTDGSAEVAEAAGARVIHEPRRGYGNAHMRGFAEARGRYIVMGDADDTYDFGGIQALLKPLDRGYDLVVGNRFKGGIQKDAMPWAHRYIGSPIINLLLRLFTGAKIGDSQSGFRAFTRDAYLRMQLRSNGMELASEMVLKSARRGLRVTEVPISYAPRVGESKLRTLRDGWRHVRFLLLFTPNFLFTMPGLLLLLAGISTFALSFAFPSGFTIGALNWQPIFAGPILVVVGSTALALGLVSRIYASAKGITEREGSLLRFYRERLSLETVLLAAALLMLAGLAVDSYLFLRWVQRAADLGIGLQLAALAQTLMIVGAHMGLTGFLASMLDVE
jgi:glycosyltransferase involved in cell wall biosynthesis